MAECPLCHDDLSGAMTRKAYGILWCHLCSFDVEDMPRADREALVRLVKDSLTEGDNP